MPIIIPPPIVKPFCNSGSQVAPPSGTDTIVANQEIGFPPLQATPLSSGGKPVNIQQLNGILKLYSQQILALVSGAQYTFDQAVSDENGGYPKDIILYDAESETFQKSLIDNNVANFVTNRSFYNDGTNWSGTFYANEVIIYPKNFGQGLTIVALNGNEFSLAPDPNQSFGGVFIWPKDLPVINGNTYALSTITTLPNIVENKWVPLKTRVTYLLTSNTPIGITNIIKFDTFYEALNLTISSPYNPATGIFTAPFDGTFKFELNMHGTYTAGSGGRSGGDLTNGAPFPDFYAPLTTLEKGAVSSGSGVAYLKLTIGQEAAIVTNDTFTPDIIAQIGNQLSISWNT